ncbi:hypothetical protein PAUR_a1306 [Pseudoalteromonas aurantia 208]|uniref:Uncharacterized protein n=1 Tax=Pseudoalteromonas aurantia 208 TaxID=1314867 RepID=A0ABR9EAS3_9GAMM|nr:hypothetical protein [Pseudoalteromonas aurantia 208]
MLHVQSGISYSELRDQIRLNAKKVQIYSKLAHKKSPNMGLSLPEQTG